MFNCNLSCLSTFQVVIKRRSTQFPCKPVLPWLGISVLNPGGEVCVADTDDALKSSGMTFHAQVSDCASVRVTCMDMFVMAFEADRGGSGLEPNWPDFG